MDVIVLHGWKINSGAGIFFLTSDMCVRIQIWACMWSTPHSKSETSRTFYVAHIFAVESMLEMFQLVQRDTGGPYLSADDSLEFSVSVRFIHFVKCSWNNKRRPITYQLNNLTRRTFMPSEYSLPEPFCRSYKQFALFVENADTYCRSLCCCTVLLSPSLYERAVWACI